MKGKKKIIAAMHRRIIALEAENAALQSEVDALTGADHPAPAWLLDGSRPVTTETLLESMHRMTQVWDAAVKASKNG